MGTIRERCYKVMAEVLEVEITSINDDSSPDTMDEWDSLAHVQLVLALEKEFEIKISPEEGIEYLTEFGEIVTFVTGKLGS